MISALQFPLDLQNILRDRGITLTILALAAVSFFILLFFSVREFVSWFTRAGKVLRVQREILFRLELLEKSNEKQMSLLRGKIDSLAQLKSVSPPVTSSPTHRFPLGPQSSEKPVSFSID